MATRASLHIKSSLNVGLHPSQNTFAIQARHLKSSWNLCADRACGLSLLLLAALTPRRRQRERLAAAQEKDDEADRIGIWELRRLTEAENRESEASKVGHWEKQTVKSIGNQHRLNAARSKKPLYQPHTYDKCPQKKTAKMPSYAHKSLGTRISRMSAGTESTYSDLTRNGMRIYGQCVREKTMGGPLHGCTAAIAAGAAFLWCCGCRFLAGQGV
jgi:hypothetical protein